MANTNHNGSRKPSGSSTHSAAHSTLTSPNVQPLRDLSGSPRFLGVGMGSTGARKPANSGWQMWGSKPSSRNPSASSAASLPDPVMLGQGNGYRSARDETWNPQRSISASWNDVAHNTQRADVSLDQQYAGQRQTNIPPSTTLDISSSAIPNTGQYTSQRYGTLDARDSTVSSRYTGASPTRAGGYGSSQTNFTVQPQLSQTSAYPSLDSSVTEEDLSSAMRGMAVEDDYSFRQGVSAKPPANDIRFSSHQLQVPVSSIPTAQQARAPFATFPQPDYSAYYSNAYPYDAYRQTPDPTLYAASPVLSTTPAVPSPYHSGTAAPVHPHGDLQHSQQSAFLYDFSAVARMHPQFYYGSPVLYHAAHARPGITAAHGQADMTRDGQFQNIAFATVPPSPAQHAFGMGPILSQIVPPAMFGHAMSVPLPHGQVHGQRGKRGNYRHYHDESNVQRSALLEDFRSDKTRAWELKNLVGHVVEFSRDQHGSRFIQTKLETATSEERQIVVSEILPDHTAELIEDVFGNYVIQKLFEFGTIAEKAQLVAAMEGNVLSLSLHMYGCRVVQKALELITSEQQSAFVNEIEGSVLKLVKDANGNHVIQKMIQAVAPERLPFVNAFRGHVLELATHPFGCRVLQRCLENMPTEHSRPLLDEMLENTFELMQDQFGNYVVQYVLEHGQPQDNKMVVSKLQGHLLTMARHKFASNVCEKALVTATPEMRRDLVDEIIAPKLEGANVVMTMMRDQYANYVLQRALSVVEGDQKQKLVDKVKPQLLQLRRHTSHFSKHLLAIDRLLEKCSQTQESFENSNAAATAQPAS